MLKEMIGKMAGRRIAVIGDLMLDRYVHGSVNRISPEAPIPVVEQREEKSCPGGAANVMRNIVTLGGQVRAFGVVGCDAAGAALKQQLGAYGMDLGAILEDPRRCTTSKTRIMAGSQQLLRIDREIVTPIPEAMQQKLLDSLTATLKRGEVDALVLEDYAKGVLTQDFAQSLVDAGNAAGVMTLLDPNPRNLLKLKNLTLLKPNRKEAYQLAGFAGQEESLPLDEIASRILDEWAPENLVISLSQDGMKLFRRNCENVHIATAAREVYDVSGAGDTVLAATSLALAAGADTVTAITLGNYAAGIAVAKLGTATVSAQELLNAIPEIR